MFSGVTCSVGAWSLLLLALVLLAVPASGAGAPPDWADAIERGDMLFSSTLPASQSLMVMIFDDSVTQSRCLSLFLSPVRGVSVIPWIDSCSSEAHVRATEFH